MTYPTDPRPDSESDAGFLRLSLSIRGGTVTVALRLTGRPWAHLDIWKVGSCDITWYIPYWLVYTTFVISVVISVQSAVIYHEIWKHRRWNITWYITCDEEAHGCYIACYMPRNMVWYILELCL